MKIIVIEKLIESKKYLLNNESYFFTEDYLHCDSLKFLEEIQSETGGYIEDCTSDGFGYYLIFSQIL